MIGYSTVTSKGQITLPAAMRKQLRLSAGKQVFITQEADGIKIQRVADISELRGSVKPRTKPEDFKTMRKNFIQYLGTRRHEKSHR